MPKASHMMPFFLSLPREEQASFMEMAQKKLAAGTQPPKKPPQTVFDKVAKRLGEHFRPENHEMLVSLIMQDLL